ncbi:hypothetical protein DDB_G0293632 [Dictyostelium discoideum AX4]|uniref:Uncharacterized protein n=1 Tax=Dictyostelium discoideum TaxID=44689 RepID=Q54BG7_DICDI|nr:hypothetical protein DDB_G0293632 [Dictyostelium discoideum AX4]EAL60628.1 hypothetical protein DDB_G0293632 [Dictyostelium discoideum AX4]|eukprot:XP_629062.1 hypothetical protein DDB_G0293632 [Dictyostelium discoideum AX4]
MNKLANTIMTESTETLADKIKKSNELRTKFKYLKNTYRTLDKISEAIYHTQIELKQYKFMINIPDEISNNLKAELEIHLQGDDKIIISKNKFKILTDCRTQVIKYSNVFNGVLKGVHRAIIKPKKIFKTFNWEKSMDIVEKTLHEEGLEIIKLDNLGENLIIHSFNSIISPEHKDQLIHCKHITILFLTTTEETKNQRKTNKEIEDEISENSKITELPNPEIKENTRINIKSKEESNHKNTSESKNNNKNKIENRKENNKEINNDNIKDKSKNEKEKENEIENKKPTTIRATTTTTTTETTNTINNIEKRKVLRVPPITVTYSVDSKEKRKMELTEDEEALEVVRKMFENEEENRIFEEKINNQKKKETPRLASIKKRQTMSPIQNPESPATPETVKRKRSNSSPNPTTNHQEISTPYKTPTKITKEESDLMEAALRDKLPKVLQDILPSVSFV